MVKTTLTSGNNENDASNTVDSSTSSGENKENNDNLSNDISSRRFEKPIQVADKCMARRIDDTWRKLNSVV